MTSKTRTWVYSLAAGAIGGGANALLTAIAIPDAVNFSHAGLINMAKVTVIGILVPVLTLLKQSPLPTDSATVTTTVTATQETTKP